MADKQLAKKGKAGVDNTFRRTWDKEDFAQRAAKREQEVNTFGSHVCIAAQTHQCLRAWLDCYRRRILRKVHLMQKRGAA